MNKHQAILIKNLDKQICPNCKSTNIGVDNWNMFEGDKDWFYYCKDCDETFRNE